MLPWNIEARLGLGAVTLLQILILLMNLKTGEVSSAIAKQRNAASHFSLEMIEHKSALTQLYCWYCPKSKVATPTAPPAWFLLS